MTAKPRIAHIAGPNATMLNAPPLVTSSKARASHGLPPLTDQDGRPLRFDALRPQRLAAPAIVYVEQFSAHPLERDAAELYGAPDGFIDAQGTFHRHRRGPADKPVYKIELRPEDGLYPLPYMAFQSDGRPWEDDCAHPGAPAALSRQPFYPDGSRVFEEIDRLGVGERGTAGLLSAHVEVDFFRVAPGGGYTKGLPALQRTDSGAGDIPPERAGHDFFPYRPYHLRTAPPRPALARVVNTVKRLLTSGKYLGAVWTEGSPRIEETVYWLHLLVDTSLPICGNASQRAHGMISNDGDKNLVDAVHYIASRVWADPDGRNRAGAVLIQEQRIFAARDVQKADARPGGYVATGGHGGILGAVGHNGPPVLTYLPTHRHTYLSEVSLARLPERVRGTAGSVTIKDAAGELLESAVPKVTIVKDGSYVADVYEEAPERDVDLLAQIENNRARHPLAGFVIEGLSPYGTLTSTARIRVMRKALYCGMPVVAVGRGNNEGFAAPQGGFIGGRNLTATKARLLLMACLMRFGSLPPANDPERPTAVERKATEELLAQYQAVFDTH